mmetsp:Transcript_1500/g.5192  ORF Transcript_1500/g.5192 Transcript_1500/m.5192 type:complete len:305 (-) Transcript_1500:618-1532(-)
MVRQLVVLQPRALVRRRRRVRRQQEVLVVLLVLLVVVVLLLLQHTDLLLLHPLLLVLPVVLVPDVLLQLLRVRLRLRLLRLLPWLALQWREVMALLPLARVLRLLLQLLDLVLELMLLQPAGEHVAVHHEAGDHLPLELPEVPPRERVASRGAARVPHGRALSRAPRPPRGKAALAPCGLEDARGLAKVLVVLPEEPAPNVVLDDARLALELQQLLRAHEGHGLVQRLLVALRDDRGHVVVIVPAIARAQRQRERALLVEAEAGEGLVDGGVPAVLADVLALGVAAWCVRVRRGSRVERRGPAR